ncbi:NAD+ synthase/NAD+ synthase (glutamine-hydrolysing) [Oryzisolibacter propanilivorax]|uniref:Glutamine-dependent NAD(+) synthetase n=1 Tax=Oryzisolibacter propanilivorax TaxID=1527607 RepID=A0A1G9VDM6_9BURK|nr:NAD(+) synthase [Oryzisolibacter propanilivorax]SDM70147.1 NAD+ synthase/NAD+ synthase (glutamine-hydrolysing) [Oryzisolibacter propanilivorax]
MLRITLAQLNPTLGDIERNTQRMLATARQAAAQGADLVVFPQLAVTGWHPGDLLDLPGFMDRVDAALEQLRQESVALPDLHWVLGAPTRVEGRPGRLHDSLLVLHGGELRLQCGRQLLATRGDFDEHRHFDAAPAAPRLLRMGRTRVALLIGAEALAEAGADDAVLAGVAAAAPDLVLHIDAHSSYLGRRAQVHAALAQAATRCGAALVSVNQIGGHDALVYDGGSLAALPGAGVVFEARRFEVDTPTLVLAEDGGLRGRQGEPLAAIDPAGLPTLEFYRRQLVLGLRDYARRCGFDKVVVGSSGGLDSALTLALAAEALGADQVVGITMPSRFSTSGSVDDSVALCRNLGIELLSHPIVDLVGACAQQFEASFGQPLAGLALENVQARLRGTVLMEYSNAFGHLLLTTGNKSESAVGYCTLYGDTNGGLGLVGDLYKTEIFELARHLNREAGRELVPQAVIDKPPSAELAPGQRDDDSLPPYPVLDEILKFFVEGPLLPPEQFDAARAFVEELLGRDDGRALVQRVRGLMARSEYKRHQSAPMLRVRPRPFGSGGWQLPIAARQG